MFDPYLRLANSVQGLRRYVEQVGSTVAAATGVRATVFPHQAGTVWRVLADVRIRHLLADEVGLGKTVQALMIINALRLEARDASVAIVVPDSLVPQWRDELLARGHEAPMFEESVRAHTERRVRLLWPNMLRRASDIDPALYSLVVVDELHNLQVEIRDHLAQNSRRFAGLLVLTATPKLQDASRRLELLALLEPDRVYAAAKRVAPASQWSRDEPFRRWPTELQEGILKYLHERERLVADLLEGCSSAWADKGLESPPAHAPQAAAALRWCLHRRIARSRRCDFRGLLPERRHGSMCVEPTASEIERQRTIWQYIRSLPSAGSVDRELLGRRAVIGSQTLRVRARELVRAGQDPDGLLSDVDAHLEPNEGDSRLDALTDMLSEIWDRNPLERIVVACQDSPTVDYLSRYIRARLPEVGPADATSPLGVAEIRGGRDDAPSDLLAADSPAQQALLEFQNGDAQLLLASDVAHVGLNLQCARVLVLYSVPWGPEEVEQWVGRLDRIGNSAIFKGGKTLPIDVNTIVQRDLVDEKIVHVLSRFRVFDSVLDLEDAYELQVAHKAVSHGALDGDWGDVDSAVRRLADIDMRTDLQEHLPYGPKFSQHVYAKEAARPPADPSLALIDDSLPPWRWREISLQAWLRLLQRSKEYDIRKAKDARNSKVEFRTLWYRSESLRRDIDTVVSLPSMHDPMERSPEHAEAFITRRSDISHPPKREVELDVKFKRALRPLQYLNHGSLLHEDLVAEWKSLVEGKDAMEGRVVFPREHPALRDPGPGSYAVTVAWADAGLHVLPDMTAEHKAELAAADEELLRHAEAGHRNDKWWLRGLLPALMLCYVERLERDKAPLPIGDPAARWRLLSPMLPQHEDRTLPQSMTWKSVENKAGIERHRSRARTALRRECSQEWSQHGEELERAIRTRLYVLSGEADSADAVNAELIAQSQSRFDRAEETAARIFKAQLDQAITTRASTSAQSADRAERLEMIPNTVASPSISLHSTTILEVVSS